MPATDPYQVVTNPQQLSTEEATRVEQYWTEDRMGEAEPVPLPVVFLPRRQREALESGVSEAAGPTISEPAMPDAAGGAQAEAGFSTQLVADMTPYPYAIVGKWFMTFGTKNYVGTGWVIGERTLFTAGHCLYDKSGGWAKNVLFRAQFNNGADAGSWALPSLASLKGWTENEDFEFDMGMGIATRPVRPVTGKAGWIANIGSIQGNIKSIGYPSRAINGYNFDGQRMWRCDGSYRNTQDNIMAMDNNMTNGCSGGPGMYEQSGKQYGIWVNSFRYTSEPNILRSPYFGTGFLNLIQWMKDNGGDA